MSLLYRVLSLYRYLYVLATIIIWNQPYSSYILYPFLNISCRFAFSYCPHIEDRHIPKHPSSL